MKILKTILKWSSLSVTLLITVILIYTYAVYNSFSFDDSRFAVDKSALQYFQNSYDDSRRAFKHLSGKMVKTSKKTKSFAVAGTHDNDLTIDTLYIPAEKKKSRLIIFSAGVHGAEGFAGSAIEQLFLKEVLPQVDRSSTGFLLIHSVNPYGMKYNRRVTENNVDLNRNSDASRKLFSIKNAGYKKLQEFLNPKKKLDTKSMGNRFFLFTAIRQIVKSSIQVLRQAILQGQYEIPKGIYFGGNDFEPQIKVLRPYLKNIAGNYNQILHLDIHTGYGERGVLHLFINPIDDKKKKTMLKKTFEGYQIDWGDSAGFYTTTGDFSELTGKLLPQKTFLPMTLEFGTMNSHTTIGSIKSLHIMLMENQGIHYGYQSEEDREKINRLIREMYYPASKEWKSEIIRISRKLLPGAIKRFQSL